MNQYSPVSSSHATIETLELNDVGNDCNHQLLTMNSLPTISSLLCVLLYLDCNCMLLGLTYLLSFFVFAGYCFTFHH